MIPVVLAQRPTTTKNSSNLTFARRKLMTLLSLSSFHTPVERDGTSSKAEGKKERKKERKKEGEILHHLTTQLFQ